MPVLIAGVSGIVLCAFLPVLPDGRYCGGLAVLLVWVARVVPPRWRLLPLVLSGLMLGLTYAGWRAGLRLAEELPVGAWQQPVTLVGTVRGLPAPGEYGVRLVLEVEQQASAGMALPGRVQLSDYQRQDWPAGSRWQLQARLKPRSGTVNAHGFDAEQWLWSEGLLARGSVGKQRQRLEDATDLSAWVDRGRSAQVERIERVLGVGRASALIAALTVGAQQRVAREDWQLFSVTGLTHLVSISGLHITMLAGMTAWLATRLLRRLPPGPFAPRMLVAGVSFAVATLYSLLAGFTIPTQRTLFMLAVWLLALCWRRNWSPPQVWWFALAVVLLMDPFSVLAPGLWLSFGLVAALMAVSLGRRRAARGLRAALTGQWAASVCSLVPLIAWFGGLPLLSPLANALAIPLVSGLLTPLALLAVMCPWDGLLHAAAWLTDIFYRGVEVLARVPLWPVPDLPWPLLALAALGSVWLIAPRGVPGKLLAGLLLLPMVLYQPQRPAMGSFQATVLDVGQGLSVLVQTAGHDLLFDTGAGDAGRVLLPQMHGLGVRGLDVLVLSHHDSDHDAAAASLTRLLPVGRIWAGQPESLPAMGLSGAACRQGQSWVWDGVRFDMLAPRADIPMNEDNAHSCILRVAGLRQALLLSGDAPAAVEEALVAQPGLRLGSAVLVAGHHGSRTASSEAWLDAVQPRLTVISAGHLNRYRHPHGQVMDRLRQRGIGVVRTDLDGALTLYFGEQLAWSCLRAEQPRYWRRRGECGKAPID